MGTGRGQWDGRSQWWERDGDNEKEEVEGGSTTGIMRRRKSRVGTGRG